MGEQSVPERYQPNDQQWRDKEWLRRKYWGEMCNTREIAEQASVSSHRHIREQMADHGIPRRPVGYKDDSGMSPFSGFYRDSPARDPDPHEHFDPEKVDSSDSKPTWVDIAERDPAVQRMGD